MYKSYMEQLKNYNTIAIVFHCECDNKKIIEEISEYIADDTIVLIKDDKKSQIVRRVMYPRNINIRSVCLDDTSNTDLILKGNPELCILLSKDSPDENLVTMYHLLVTYNKKFILLDDNNKIILKLNETEAVKEDIVHKNGEQAYNKYQQIIDKEYIERFKNTADLVNDLNLRQKSKKKIVKQLKKLHYYETVRNNNAKSVIKEDEPVCPLEKSKEVSKLCLSITNKGQRCKNHALKGSKYCGIKSHKCI